MKKREAEFTVYFRHWLKANPMKSGAFELKQTTTNSLDFSDVKDHQLDALLASNSKSLGFLYKIPDDSRGIKPYDMIYLRDSKSYLVIKYPKFFVLIDPFVFVEEKTISNRKSLTSERAREISTIAIDL